MSRQFLATEIDREVLPLRIDLILKVLSMLPVWTIDSGGAPERIRTSDLCLRRATLYPAELRALYKKQKFTRFVDITNESLADLAELS